MAQKLKTNEYTFLKENSFELARKKIKKEQNKKIIFSSNNEEVYRKIIEKEKIHALLLLQENRKDHSKQRDSGLNQVLTKIAKKKGIKIGIFIDELIESNNKSRILARIKQNINLLKKKNLDIIFVHSKKNKRDIK